MLTATSQLDIKTQSYNLGCDDYLSKPFDTGTNFKNKKLLNPRINNIKVDKVLFWRFYL